MFSQAFNNEVYMSGKPDPQTGTFPYVHKFGLLRADSGLGPEMELLMSFNVLDTGSQLNTTGLGSGFSFRLGGYNRDKAVLTLSNGKSYEVFWGGMGEWSLSHKLKDISVEMVSQSEIHVKHKNGDLEVLVCDNSACTVFFLQRYVAASGRYLEFSYQYLNSVYCLTQVIDTYGSVLATVDYEPNKAVVTMYPNSEPEKKAYMLNSDADGRLYSLELPESKNVLFTYEMTGIMGTELYPISKVEHPNGMIEEAVYWSSLSLPAGAPIPSMPAISTYTKTLADSYSVSTDFTYSDDFNFWGNNGASWQDNRDNLIHVDWDYQYSSLIECGDKKVTKTYNKFHQEFLAEELNGDRSITRTTTSEYYSLNDSSIDDQPTQFELLKSVSIQFKSSTEESSLPEIVSYTYDDYGNILEEVKASGVKTINDYYSAKGGSGCPPNPYGLVAYKKKETIQPNNGGESKVRSFKYRAIVGVDGERNRCIVLHKETFGDSKTTFTYYDAFYPMSQASMKSKSVSTGGFASTILRHFSFSDDEVTASDTLVGHDGLVTSIARTYSRMTGLVRREKDSVGLITAYTYDVTGRLLSVTSSPSSDYEATTTFSYVDKPNGKIGTSVTQSSPSDPTKFVYYDGEMNELRVDVKGRLQTQTLTISEKSYDNQGRLEKDGHYDYSFSENFPFRIEQKLLDEITNVYGALGEIKGVTHNSGVTESIDINPFKKTKTTQLIPIERASTKIPYSTTPTVTHYNAFGKVSQVDVLTLAGGVYSSLKYGYDGFGRRVSITSPSSASASLEYDEYDRPVGANLYDRTAFVIDYPSFTHKAVPSSVQLPSNGFVLKKEKYDSLLRTVSRTANGVKTVFDYVDSQPKPSSLVNGRGQTVLFQYVPELGMQTSQVSTYSSEVEAGDYSNSSKLYDNLFQFDPVSGKLVSATRPSYEYSVSYKNGLIESSSQKIGQTSKTIANEKMTLLGKPLRLAIGLRKVLITYDDLGRISSTTDGEFEVKTFYDGLDRVKSLSLAKSGSQVLHIAILYDEYNREILRQISGTRIMKIQTRYDNMNRINRVVTSIDGSLSLTENFSYDVKGRLSSYGAVTSSNRLLPRNEYGKPFKSQKFSYDVLDNVISIVTTFPSDESDEAKFYYGSTNQFRLKKVTHSLVSGDNAYPSQVVFEYDKDGHIVSVGDRKMTYTVSGRLKSLDNSCYSYDPFDRLLQCMQVLRFYSGSAVIDETKSILINTKFIMHGDVPVGQYVREGFKLFGANRQGSVIVVNDGSSVSSTTYSPFGSGDNGARFGFKGELKDVSDVAFYPVGNGLRAFMPFIASFNAYDMYSPFLGPINPYRYSGGDPVNEVSGFHVSHVIGAEKSAPDGFRRLPDECGSGQYVSLVSGELDSVSTTEAKVASVPAQYQSRARGDANIEYALSLAYGLPVNRFSYHQ